MAKYRTSLPQLAGDLFISDGGLETTLVFEHGIDLPYFAAIDLMKDDAGRERIADYFRPYLDIAREYGVGMILQACTWRGSPEWGERLGYTAEEFRELNRKAIDLAAMLREEYERNATRVVISGCMGPRGDGYRPDLRMDPDEAEAYHLTQARWLAETDADLLTALTLNYIDEAIGIVRAAQAVNMPVVISFTVETDGKLATGDSLEHAIASVDAATDSGPAYYMINCAHPTHFEHILDGRAWQDRVRGIRANASRLSHAELDRAAALDSGNPVELGREYAALRGKLPGLVLLAGCCGTDTRHIREICRSCTTPRET